MTGLEIRGLALELHGRRILDGVDVDVPGGRLTVTHDAADRWWLAGPAVLVADGETSL